MKRSRPKDLLLFLCYVGVYAELCQDLILGNSAAKEKFTVSL